VIANFNNASFVAAAIESAARQTIRDIRIVVVDDASTDNSDEIIRDKLSQLNDPRLRYVRLADNAGQSGALRCGLAELQEPFVAFLDSDDYWYPEFLERQLSAHLNADFPVALTFCDSHIVDAAGRLLAGTAWWFDYNDAAPAHRLIDAARLPRIAPETGKVDFAPIKHVVLRTEWSPDSATNTMSGMMFRRSFIDLVLVTPAPRIALHVDFYLSTLAVLLTGAAAIYDSLYAYRMHGTNLHSNGQLHGGTYNSSKADWDPIRTNILHLIGEILQSQAGPLRKAFGDYHCNLAEARLARALNPQPPATGWRRLRQLVGLA